MSLETAYKCEGSLAIQIGTAFVLLYGKSKLSCRVNFFREIRNANNETKLALRTYAWLD